jgi:drug/metabolite transporter (DMT)-like permease
MSNHLKGILMVLSSTAMWGLVGILVQYLISSEYFTPEWLVASGIILLVITYLFYERNIFKVLKRDFVSLLLLGVIGLLGSQYGFYQMRA